METKYGFTKMTLQEFESWINNLRVARTIMKIQQHHTYIPSYIHFNGSNHFERQHAMKNHHVNNNGWQDIGQHFTIFPDGSIVTGRSLEKTPACITNQNAHSICIENFGNFDTNEDIMNVSQRDAIIAVTVALCKKFSIQPNDNTIVYHHWYRLDNGARNNGAGNNKSCPGTGFFGGNKVHDFNNHFLPLVLNNINGQVPVVSNVTITKYVSVATDILNIRTGPAASYPKATDRQAVERGAVLRVYAEQVGWYRISSSAQHWIAGRYTIDVKKAVVNATALNVRTGPGASFPKTGSVVKNEEVFIFEEANGWCKISLDEKWVSKTYLNL